MMLLTLLLCSCGGGGPTSAPTLTPAPTITSVSVSCNPDSVQAGETSQCTAAVTGTGDYSFAVTWSASAGTISSDGIYTAPGTVPNSIGLAPLVYASTGSSDTRIIATPYQLLLFHTMLCNLLILNYISTLNQ
jgi:hypothetical protein